jgi:hypothetical protein
MSEEVLSYLQGDSMGARRDLIARCYYEVAQGDPKSAPVAFAVLLDACAEQFAKTPNILRGLTSDFMSAVNTARQLERNVIERQEKGFAHVIAAFKDENARASITLRETALEARSTVVQADRLHGEMKPVIARTEEIGKDLLLLRDDLRRFDTSVERSEKTVGEVKDIHTTTLEIIKHLTKEVRANWTTIGLGFGMTLEYALAESLQPAPFYAHFVLFAVLASIIQGLLRWEWRYMRTLVKKILPSAKTKPAD